MIEMKKKCLLS